jgi:hypothetical protein
MADFTIFRRHRSARGGGVFNFITCTGLWVDEDVVMSAVEVKGMDPKYSRELTDVYGAPNEHMLTIRRSAARTQVSETQLHRRRFELTSGGWNGDAGKTSGFQAFVNTVIGVMVILRQQEARQEENRCWTFTYSDLIIRLPLVTLYPESAIIVQNGSRMGRNLSTAKNGKNSPVIPQDRCFRFTNLSLKKIYLVGWKW